MEGELELGLVKVVALEIEQKKVELELGPVKLPHWRLDKRRLRLNISW